MVTADARSCPMCGESINSEDMRQCPACGELLVADGGPSTTAVQSTEDFAKGKRRRLLLMLVLAVMAGIATQIYPDAERELELLEGIGIAILVVSWCNVDARERETTIGKLQFVAIFFITLIGLPVYFFRTRGLRGFFSILLALLFYALLIGLQAAVMAITHLVV